MTTQSLGDRTYCARVSRYRERVLLLASAETALSSVAEYAIYTSKPTATATRNSTGNRRALRSARRFLRSWASQNWSCLLLLAPGSWGWAAAACRLAGAWRPRYC